MSDSESLKRLVDVFGASAEKYGATPRGVGWPNAQDCVRRFDAMFDMVRESGPIRVLDVGCGPGLTLDYLEARGWLERVDYVGVDITPKMIELAARDWPHYHFELRDVLTAPFPPDSFDYALVNGIFTGRYGLPHAGMEDLMLRVLRAIWPSVRRAIAWNVMSTHVDYERDDLFHWPTDSAIAFACAELGRNVVIRADYGLYEYTVQVYRSPPGPSVAVPERWSRDAPGQGNSPQR